MKLLKLIPVLLITAFAGHATAENPKAQVLVLIHSDTGGTLEMAREIAAGIERGGSAAVIKRVSDSGGAGLKDFPVATVEELPGYDGIAFGSPVYFGNISTAMSGFLAKTTTLWSEQALLGKPATVFMSAGGGAGRELAIQSFWNTLAVHGMVLVPTGILGTGEIDKSIPQGNTVLGTTSLASQKQVPRPSDGERHLAREQGAHFAGIVTALRGAKHELVKAAPAKDTVKANLQRKNIVLPPAPQPVGNYTPYARAG
ncbi:MAG: NAD(P)H:quinone oxidoreductase, partial [Verrucomicrobiaceae bacterium]